jgi:hypothetical protein
VALPRSFCKKPGRTRLFIFLALLQFTIPTRAADYWVIGSFEEEARAVTEQKRIIATTGSDALVSAVQIDDKIFHRVLLGPINESLNLLLGDTDSFWRLRDFEPDAQVQNRKATNTTTIVSGLSSKYQQQKPESDTVTFNLAKVHPTTSSTSMSDKRSNFSGYIKSFAVAQDKIENGLINLDTTYQSQNSARLMWEKINDDTVYQIHYEISPVFVSNQQPIESRTFAVVGESYRLTDIQSSLTDEDSKTQVYQNLDRLNMQWQFDRGDLTIGRQAISFGAARFINPTDIFLPFNVQTLNQEYRTGVDAIRFQSPLGELGELDFGLVLGDEAKPENSAAFLQMRTNLAGNDLNFNLTRFAEQTMVGTGIQSALWDFGFWFEIAGVDGDVDYVRTSVGIDYALSENIFAMVEYHYNGAGSDNPADYLGLFATIPYQRGGVFLLGQDYIMPSISFQVSPLWSIAAQAIYNLNDNSAFFSASAEYNVAEDFYMDFGYYHFIGDELSLTAMGIPVLESEYGSNPNVLYTSLRFYF